MRYTLQDRISAIRISRFRIKQSRHSVENIIETVTRQIVIQVHIILRIISRHTMIGQDDKINQVKDIQSTGFSKEVT